MKRVDRDRSSRAVVAHAKDTTHLLDVARAEGYRFTDAELVNAVQDLAERKRRPPPASGFEWMRWYEGAVDRRGAGSAWLHLLRAARIEMAERTRSDV